MKRRGPSGNSGECRRLPWKYGPACCSLTSAPCREWPELNVFNDILGGQSPQQMPQAPIQGQARGGKTRGRNELLLLFI
jgi:hypothetical protein